MMETKEGTTLSISLKKCHCEKKIIFFFVRKSFVKKGFQSLRLKWLIFICGFCAHYSLQGTLVPFFPFSVGIKGIKESSPGRRFFNITKYFLFLTFNCFGDILRPEKMRFISIV